MDYGTAVKRVNMDDDLLELVDQVKQIAIMNRIDYISPYGLVVSATMDYANEGHEGHIDNMRNCVYENISLSLETMIGSWKLYS